MGFAPLASSPLGSKPKGKKTRGHRRKPFPSFVYIQRDCPTQASHLGGSDLEHSLSFQQLQKLERKH